MHISWAPTQTSELAVIDAAGRVLILNFNSNLNKMHPSRKWDTDPVDDLHAVVGTYWMNPIPSHRGVVSWLVPFRYHPASYCATNSCARGIYYTHQS